MDKYDKTKLKVLIKSILLERSPKPMTAKQLANKINRNDWAFQTSIDSAKIGQLLKVELKRNDNHFLKCIKSKDWKTGKVYFIPLDNTK